MRILFFILVFISLFYSCKQKRFLRYSSSTNQSKESIVSDIFLVNGTVTQSFSYCGGMRPTDEDYYEMTRAKPMSGTFFIRRGLFNDVNEKIIDTIVSDAHGKFSIQLPKGEYCIIGHDRLDSNYVKSILKNHSKPTQYYSAADSNCLYRWLKSPLTYFKLDSVETTSISWDIHHPCSWDDIICVDYFGPLPP